MKPNVNIFDPVKGWQESSYGEGWWPEFDPGNPRGGRRESTHKVIRTHTYIQTHICIFVCLYVCMFVEEVGPVL